MKEEAATVLSELGLTVSDLVRITLTRVANDKALPHPLNGEWADHRECHIGGDFLLIYQIEDQRIVL